VIHFHEVTLTPTINSILKNFVGQVSRIIGFSWHHQAVKFSANTPFEVAGIVPGSPFPEALESRNGRAFLSQFHPEYYRRKDIDGVHDKEAWGEKILRGIYSRAQRITSKLCSRALAN
jgi:gamma-glutamyl-gamma-aminobutyrate hydrolase PuuD